ncbi:MAG: alkaline phosphatase family protein [Thermoanaerobaculia bacterium]|nr:alkaline phosphatase family protein [Thermoanaerobaculia bacterium]
MTNPHPPSSRKAFLASFLPGGLAGAHLLGLLYFLNPGLPLAGLDLARALLRLSSGLAVASAILLLPWTIERPRATLRMLPWLISFVLGASSILAAAHASYFAYYLPPGVNIRLIKASMFLGLAALICFYTALLHALSNRRYGRRSRMGIWFLAIASLYVVVERREAYRPDHRPTLASSVEDPRPASLLVVGLGGASLDAILPLAQQGQLPFLAESLRVGSYARLRPLRPLRHDPAWVTLATGKWPYKHGIRDQNRFVAPILGGGTEFALLPIGLRRWLGFHSHQALSGADRDARTAWEISARLGIPSGVVGWPEATSTEPGVLFALSDQFFSGKDDLGLAPASQKGRMVSLRAASTVSHPLVSELPERTRTVVEGALAGDQARLAVFRVLAGENPQARALFLQLPGLSSVSERYFGGYAEHPFDGGGRDGLDDAARAVAAYYRWLDGELAELRESVQGPAVLVVVSAHGYRQPGWWDHRGIPSRQEQGLGDADADGVLVIRGHGIQADSYVAGAGVEDVLPTLLFAMGLPTARDFDGHALTKVFEPTELAARPLTFLPSYETLVSDRNR